MFILLAFTGVPPPPHHRIKANSIYNLPEILDSSVVPSEERKCKRAMFIAFKRRAFRKRLRKKKGKHKHKLNRKEKQGKEIKLTG